MTIKYQIQGEDHVYGNGNYIKPELYDTYEEAFAHAHTNREWVREVDVIDVYAEGKRRFRYILPA